MLWYFALVCGWGGGDGGGGMGIVVGGLKVWWGRGEGVVGEG